MNPEKSASKSLLTFCLVATTALHLCALTYLFRNPLFFHTPFSPFASHDARASLYLHEAFGSIITAEEEKSALVLHSNPAQAALQEEAFFAWSPHLKAAPYLPTDGRTPLNEPIFQEFLAKGPSDLISVGTPLELQASMHWTLPHSEELEKALPAIPGVAKESSEDKRAPPPPSAQEPPKGSNAPLSDAIAFLPTSYSEEADSLFAQKKGEEPLALPLLQDKASPLDYTFKSFGKEGLLAAEFYLPEHPILSFSDWSDFFHLEALALPLEEAQECRFALTLTPKDDLSSIQMRQNFLFCIDASNSIEKHRLAGFKRAVLRALGELKGEHTFNIVVFDRKLYRLSKENLAPTRKNLLAAKQFLEAKEVGSECSATEIFAVLPKLLPQKVCEKEMHIAILLTDGTTSLPKDRQKKALLALIEKNRQQIALYPATCGRGNDLSSLKTLAYLNGGEVLYSPTHAAFGRKLAKCVKELSAPLAKSLFISITASDSSHDAQLITASPHLPSLYNHLPYTVYGLTPSAQDELTFVLQAIHKDQPIVIQKKLLLTKAYSKSPGLEKAWLENCAKSHFAEYIQHGSKEKLKEARLLEKEAASIPLRQVRALKS